MADSKQEPENTAGEAVARSDKVAQIDKNTVELVFDLLKEAPKRQTEISNLLDTKMVQIFQAGTVVIGLAGFSSGNVARQQVIVAILLLLALVSYAITAYIAFYHLHPERFRVLKADALWRVTWKMKPEDAQRTVIADATKAYAYNEPILDRKARNLRLALIMTSVEVILGRISPYSFSCGSSAE